MIGLFDWAIWGVYLIVLLLIMWFVQRRLPKLERRLHWVGFVVKVFGGVAFTLIFTYYYNGIGDTFLYSQGASVLADVLLESPMDYLRLLFTPAGFQSGNLSAYTDQIYYFSTAEEWFMVKLLSPFLVLSFQSYFVATLLLSTFSFYGAWKLFAVFKHALPNHIYLGFIAAFLIPSTVFWGGGMVKDTITMGGINVIIYALYFGLRNKFSLKLLLQALFFAYLILGLKAYILLAFSPSFFLIVYRFLLALTDSRAIQFFLTPLLILLITGASFFAFQNLSAISGKYNQENLKSQLIGFHTWHATIGSSAYSLGEIDYTPLGIAKKVPISLATTFFMPFVWNARNPVILMSALESLALTILLLVVSMRTKLRLMKYLDIKYFRALVVFIVLFGFVVGFTSYNFGALSRYKIPIMPLAVFILFYINARYKSISKT